MCVWCFKNMSSQEDWKIETALIRRGHDLVFMCSLILTLKIQKFCPYWTQMLLRKFDVSLEKFLIM